MANLVFRKYRAAAWTGLLDLSSADLRALLVMTDSTATSELGAEFITDLSVLDEFNGSGYARVDLASLVLAEDVALDAYTVDGDDADFGSVVGGSRSIKGVVVYEHFGADSANRLAAFIDNVASGPVFPYAAIGNPLRVLWDADGILKL